MAKLGNADKLQRNFTDNLEKLDPLMENSRPASGVEQYTRSESAPFPKDSHEVYPSLSESMMDLSSVIQQLKAQLMHVIGLNESLEIDLGAARRKLKEQLDERENLVMTIEKMEQDIISLKDTRSEVNQLLRERDRLVEKIQDLSQSLAYSEQRVLELGQLLDKFRAERNDASEEAVSLESQFARAFKVIEELRKELNSSQKREKDLESCLKPIQEQLKSTLKQRDTLQAELLESRNAFEEIRQSILTAARA